MAALESLPPDQRAVLQLVLRQGRSYADLAGLLKITPAAVRDRAHAAVTALAGEQLPAESRERVADYLLGQLGVSERAQAREELSTSEPARAWAHAAAEALEPMAGGALPEIPEAGSAPAAVPVEPAAEQPEPAPVAPAPEQPAPATAPVEPREEAGKPEGEEPAPVEGEPRPSRLGGLALLAGLAILAAAIVLALLVNGGGKDKGSGSKSTPVGTTSAERSTNPSRPGTTPSSPTTPSAPGTTVVTQVNLTAPQGGSGLAVARLVVQGKTPRFDVAAQGIPKPGAGAFLGVWLTGPKVPPVLLGAVKDAAIKNGSFSGAAPVPPSVRSYDQMVLARQQGDPSRTKPATPGAVVVAGRLSIPRQ